MSCRQCNKPKERCGCKPTSMTIDNLCNPIDCSTETCSEIYPAQCVIYQGEDIVCNDIIVATAGDSIANVIEVLTGLACSNICNLSSSISAEVIGETIELTVNVNNGSGNYSYEWSVISAGAIGIELLSNTNSSTTVIANNNGAPFGLIQVIVTDITTGCQVTATYFVAINVEIQG